MNRYTDSRFSKSNSTYEQNRRESRHSEEAAAISSSSSQSYSVTSYGQRYLQSYSNKTYGNWHKDGFPGSSYIASHSTYVASNYNNSENKNHYASNGKQKSSLQAVHPTYETNRHKNSYAKEVNSMQQASCCSSSFTSSHDAQDLSLLCDPEDNIPKRWLTKGFGRMLDKYYGSYSDEENAVTGTKQSCSSSKSVSSAKKDNRRSDSRREEVTACKQQQDRYPSPSSSRYGNSLIFDPADKVPKSWHKTGFEKMHDKYHYGSDKKETPSTSNEKQSPETDISNDVTESDEEAQKIYDVTESDEEAQKIYDELADQYHPRHYIQCEDSDEDDPFWRYITESDPEDSSSKDDSPGDHSEDLHELIEQYGNHTVDNKCDVDESPKDESNGDQSCGFNDGNDVGNGYYDDKNDQDDDAGNDYEDGYGNYDYDYYYENYYGSDHSDD